MERSIRQGNYSKHEVGERKAVHRSNRREHVSFFVSDHQLWISTRRNATIMQRIRKEGGSTSVSMTDSSVF